MLSKPHVVQALEAKKSAFTQYQRQAGLQAKQYLDALTRLAKRSAPEILEALQGVPLSGARPSAERRAGQSLVRPFGPRWPNHREARGWAYETLEGVPTFAVDGSQIPPDLSYSIPVGAVQIGWFDNRHQPDGHYVKDLYFEVLAPEDLEEKESPRDAFPDIEVNVRRFELETQALTKYMLRSAGADPAPVCIFDGSFVISFAAQMRPALRRRYVNAVLDMLRASERTRVPIVGYVDNSHARDLVWMLHWLWPHSQTPTLCDGALLREQMRWGDRTEALVCARDDGLFREGDQLAYYDQVHLVYLKTTRERPPARLEVPAWLLEQGQLERVVDVMRAETIVGTGYPYAIETADALAVITREDRERFYRTFQEYAEALGLELRYARKALSKRQRR